MDLLPISGLQHLLYCDRQCALIHLEQAWAENQFTAEGNVMHEKAHNGPDEVRAGVRTVRGLPVKSETLGLSGQCDVVEFAADGSVLPVEYKRGKPKGHRADEVQLCAQALCLEETLGMLIPEGRLFYGQTRRRVDVAFDPELRALTVDAARRLQTLIASSATPSAVYEEWKCENCSLKELCLPRAMRFQKGAEAWFQRQLTGSLEATE
ncbi:MAG: CRISPR-associated RecB family exonuclease Cas4 [Verrucomicrobiaceae bacterium]|nr:CRISPR-associated RecB family exonuclease Cas4 [Verrucomicrobiaceae bacterium]